jgi:hypothetical protein
MGKMILSRAVMALIPAMVERGMTKREIAAHLGCKPETLQVRCCNAGISLRKGGTMQRRRWRLPKSPTPLNLSNQAMATMANWAASKGCSDTRVASRLLEVIARDNLYDAVLDDRRLFHKEFEPS